MGGVPTPAVAMGGWVGVGGVPTPAVAVGGWVGLFHDGEVLIHLRVSCQHTTSDIIALAQPTSLRSLVCQSVRFHVCLSAEQPSSGLSQHIQQSVHPRVHLLHRFPLAIVHVQGYALHVCK